MLPVIPSASLMRWALIAAMFGTASVSICGQDSTSQSKGSASTISGKVQTREGEPLTNARVTITRYGATSNAQSIRVDSSGSFTTEQLEPGLYVVSTYVPGYVTDAAQTVPASGMYRPGDSVTLILAKGGAITGTVKNSTGDPMVAVVVRAIPIRELGGRTIQLAGMNRERLTDDRGVYRLYGLPPGRYLVSAGGYARFSGGVPPTPFETDAPTYAPSSTRDGATQVTLSNGDEATVDIQYRGEPGHAVSGIVAGATTGIGPESWAASVTLYDSRQNADVGAATATSFNNFIFTMYGVPDGEYELYATQGSSSGEVLASSPVQVRVQGADVTGLNLSVRPLASIKGRVVLESDSKAACGTRRASSLAETVIVARRYEPEQKPLSRSGKESPEIPQRFLNSAGQSFVDAAGTFTIKNLRGGTFRIDAREPGSGWFVRSIALGNMRPANIARDGLSVRSGEQVSGLAVTISEGAAKLRGRISMAEGQLLPSAVRVYLTPSERESAQNTLRFHEVRPDASGSFTIENIAPGKYWIIAHPAEETETGTAKSIRLDGAFRTRIVREAEALKRDLTFKPCDQVNDFDLPYSSASNSPL